MNHVSGASRFAKLRSFWAVVRKVFPKRTVRDVTAETAQTISIFPVFGSCCANEWLSASGCRYDLARFGCVFVDRPEEAQVLWLGSALTEPMVPLIQNVYSKLQKPAKVVASGACALSGGAFHDLSNPALKTRIQDLMPVDLMIPGCPPRPEVLMEGVLRLQRLCRGQDH